MSFGDDLRTQLTDLQRYTENGIALLNDARDFVKERVEIERDYADKIEKLSKKYAKQAHKPGVTFYGAGLAFKADNAGSETGSIASIPGSDGATTVSTAWFTLLQQTEAMGRAHLALAESWKEAIANALKHERGRKDEALKKASQLDASRQDMEKARSSYKKASTEVDTAYKTYEKYMAQGDVGHIQKASADWNNAVAEKNERLNEYILSLRVYNAHIQRHYDVDLPTMARHIQEMNEHISQRCREIMTEAIRLDNQCLDEARKCNDISQAAISAISGPADSSTFVQAVKRDPRPPQLEPFMPYSNVDQDALESETTKAQLLNALLALRNVLQKQEADVVVRSKEVEKVAQLRNTYAADVRFGDPDEANEQVIESERQLLTLELQRMKTAVQVENIQEIVGAIDLKAHETKGSSSGSCIVCGGSFSLISRGMKCSGCDVRFHPKCAAKVPPCGVPRTELMPATPTSAEPLNRAAGGGATLRPTKTITRRTAAGTASQISFGGPGASDSAELSVHANDRIRVLLVDDGNGWMQAELNGVRGLIPTNYCVLEEIPQHTSQVANEVAPGPAVYVVPAADAAPAGNAKKKTVAKKAQALPRVRALYDYDANADGELTLREGDIIEVTQRDVGQGWSEGVLNGKQGQFPANYVEDM